MIDQYFENFCTRITFTNGGYYLKRWVIFYLKQTADKLSDLSVLILLGMIKPNEKNLFNKDYIV